VHHAVHGLVRQFGGCFDIGAIEGRETGAEGQIRRGTAQILWQPVGQ